MELSKVVLATIVMLLPADVLAQELPFGGAPVGMPSATALAGDQA